MFLSCGLDNAADCVLAGCAFWQQSLRPVRNLRCWGRQGPTADSPAPPQPQLLNHKLPRRKETEPLKQKKKEKDRKDLPASLTVPRGDPWLPGKLPNPLHPAHLGTAWVAVLGKAAIFASSPGMHSQGL